MMDRTRLVVAVLALAVACKAEPEDPCAVDTDGDGLDDCEEAELGTAIHLADTDGDGFSDYHEVVELGFSAENNNFRFNPLIADTPRLRATIVSAPQILLDLQNSSQVTRTDGVQRTDSSTNAVTTGTSSTESRAVEVSETWGSSLTAGGTTGIFGGLSASATVSYDRTKSTTEETSMTWSSEQRTENTEELARMQEEAKTNSETITGGRIRVAVEVTNDGNLAYTLSSLTVTALMSSPGADAILVPVGNLTFDTSIPVFPEFTSAPGSSNGPFVFEKDDLDVPTALRLLEDSRSLDLRITSYEVSDAEGRSFTHEQTEISAKTATILVDYDGKDGRPAERYQVATNVDPDTLRTTVGHVLDDVLKLPYSLDERGHLAEARSIAALPDLGANWVVVHQTTDGVSPTVSRPLVGEAIALQDIELKAGDVFHLVLVEDVDGDGLGRRLEASVGTSPLLADSDGDGVDDGIELLDDGTDPTSPNGT